MLTIADVAKDRIYYRQIYVGSEAIGSSCGGSQMGSCNLARSDWLLYYSPGWEHSVVPIYVGWTHRHATLLLLTHFSVWYQVLLPKLRRWLKCKENI